MGITIIQLGDDSWITVMESEADRKVGNLVHLKESFEGWCLYILLRPLAFSNPMPGSIPIICRNFLTWNW